VVRVLPAAARGLYRTRLPQIAAALSFRTIFGMIPALVLGLVVLGAFATEQDVQSALDRFMEYAGLSEIVVADGSAADRAGETGGQPGPGVGEATDEARGDAPDEGAGAGAQRLDEWIQRLVVKVGQIRLEAIGAVGLLMLVYAAISMLVEIERAFNQVYGAPSGRAWSRRLTLYWTLLTLGTIGLVATFVVGERFKVWVTSLAQGGTSGGGQTLVTLLGFGVTVAISTFLLFMLYTIVPNTRVRFRPALAGAVVAAILWEAGKWGFRAYVGYSISYARLYGALALIPLFMLWVYLTWLVVLFGAQISQALQNFPRWVEQERQRQRGADRPAIVDPDALLAMLACAARRFQTGKPASLSDLAEHADLDEGTADRLAGALVSAGLLHRVQMPDGEPALALARPPEQIDAADVLGVGRDMAGGRSRLARLPALAALADRRLECARGRTLLRLSEGDGQTNGHPDPEGGLS